jgi:hypothetical protein
MAKPSDKAVQAVVQAWTDPGREPQHHYAVMHWLAHEWPALANAVQNLANEADGGK